MSKESAKKFIEEVNNGSHLKKELESIKNKEDAQKTIKKKGFSFSKKEFQEAYKESIGRDLSDEELKQVAAGRVPNSPVAILDVES